MKNDLYPGTILLLTKVENDSPCNINCVSRENIHCEMKRKHVQMRKTHKENMAQVKNREEYVEQRWTARSKQRKAQYLTENRRKQLMLNRIKSVMKPTIKVVQRQISNPQHAAVGGLVQAPFPNDSTHVRMSRLPNNRLEGHCI